MNLIRNKNKFKLFLKWYLILLRKIIVLIIIDRIRTLNFEKNPTYPILLISIPKAFTMNKLETNFFVDVAYEILTYHLNTRSIDIHNNNNYYSMIILIILFLIENSKKLSYCLLPVYN